MDLEAVRSHPGLLRWRRRTRPLAWRWGRRARRVLSLGLLLCAGLVFATGPPASPATGPTVRIWVAARDLPLGATPGSGDLDAVDFPLSLAPDGALPVAGSLRRPLVLAAPVRAGEPLTDVRLLDPRLTGGLRPGQTAVPLRLGDAGVGRLLSPGDRVDLYAVGPDPPGSELVAAGTLVLGVPPDGDDGIGEGTIVIVAADRPTAGRLLTAVFDGAVAATLSPP